MSLSATELPKIQWHGVMRSRQERMVLAQLRHSILRWLKDHSKLLGGISPEETMAQWESRVARRAQPRAWLAAAEVVVERAHDWEKRWGQHAGDRFTTLEICHQLALDMKHMIPSGEGLRRMESVGELIGRTELERGVPVDVWLVRKELPVGLTPESVASIQRWAAIVGKLESKKAWRGMVAYTRHRGGSLASEQGLSDDHYWEGTHNYAKVATRVCYLLAKDFEEQAEQVLP